MHEVVLERIVLEGSLIIIIVGVCPLQYRRVVHIKYQSSESAQLIYIEGLSTKKIIGVGPLLVSEGCPQIKTNILF